MVELASKLLLLRVRVEGFKKEILFLFTKGIKIDENSKP